MGNFASRQSQPAFPLTAEAGKELRLAVFDRVTAVIPDCRHFFIAPDGQLTQIPFETLPLDDGRMVGDVYEVSYLSTGRDVLRFGVPASGQPSVPIVAADPDFDLTLNNSEPSTVPVAVAVPVSLTHKATFLSRDLDRSYSYRRLPGARFEGELVAKLLKAFKVEAWKPEKILDAHLKAIQSPWIFHLATHGHFLPDHKFVARQYDFVSNQGAFGSGPARFVGLGMENPMVRSWLVLAGANSWMKGDPPPADAEDGHLTAADVTGMDLLNTELVVLLACETGVGEVRTREGVLGLRHAFMLAGAKTLVMSLWTVNDLATALLMERFYQNLLQQHLPRSEALREAQKFVRTITIGELRQHWLSEHMIEKLTAGNPD